MKRITASYQDVTRVKADIFVAGITTDVRPPRGIAGKVDWYLGGFISRQMLEGTLKGRAGEMTLMDIRGKLLTPRLLIIGLGKEVSLNREAAAAHFRRLGSAVRDLGLGKVALEIPAMETPKGGTYVILSETLRGFKEAYEEGDSKMYYEIQILARNEKESEGWRRVVRSFLI